MIFAVVAERIPGPIRHGLIIKFNPHQRLVYQPLVREQPIPRLLKASLSCVPTTGGRLNQSENSLGCHWERVNFDAKR